MKNFAIHGRCLAAPPPPDWREQLTRMLGAKPRRIGNWAELGLYGALSCMADAGEQALAPDALLMLSSRCGPYTATIAVVEQMQHELPMPLTFLQTQPNQVLALLAAQINWQGHACFVAGGAPEAMLRLAAAQSSEGGMLLGWVDETAGSLTHWLRLRPDSTNEKGFVNVSGNDLFSPEIRYLSVTDTGQVQAL